MANEFFAAFGGDVAISILPGGHGRLEVYLDGEKLFDRVEEGEIYPDLGRVKAIRRQIQAKLDSVPVHSDD